MKHLTLLLGYLSCIFLLCTPFATNSGLANGLVMGKVFWFHLSMLLFSCCIILSTFNRKYDLFKLSLPDLLWVAFAGITFATYDWELNPEPEKLFFGGQLFAGWFMLRFMLHKYPHLSSFFLFVIATTGVLEAVMGMAQLHGFESSNHSMFNITGTFYNPGPYSGYLAMILPVCLSIALSTQKAIHYYMWAAVLATVVVLPAGMSRSAWLAAAFSCGWIYWMQAIGWEKTKMKFTLHRKRTFLVIAIVSILAVFATAGLYHLKRDSADGRLLMWKITGKSIVERPATGVGLGGFPAAFAIAQANYFQSGKAAETEKLVAGCPEYAFNEYLQIGSEQGVVGLLVFLLWIGCICRMGIKNKRTGAVGGVLSFAVFALSAYPLQLPEFWILLLFLGVICVTSPEGSVSVQTEKRDTWMLSGKGGIILMALISIGIGIRQKDFYKAYKKWNRTQMLYNNKAYEAATDDYISLHPLLKGKPEFLFEESQCLNKTEQYAEAVKVLERATQLSADPMIWYTLAKNKQALGEYEQAEKLLQQAIDIVPERIYPYYLLTRLYAEPEFFQPDKLRASANAVLTKEPKVNSQAIREMRNEVNKILDKCNNQNTIIQQNNQDGLSE